VYKSGEKEGQPRTDYFMALAVEKTNTLGIALKKQIEDLAALAFPDLHTNGVLKEGAELSTKVTDGDSTKVNKKGKRPCDQEGYPGHWVFSFNTSTPPECFTKGGASRIKDPKDVKTGYFIRINGNMQPNGSKGNPGIYLNPNMVELVAYGAEIRGNRPEASSVFGGAPEEALPAGASATPVDDSPAAEGVQPPPPATEEAAPPPPPAETPRMYTYQGKQYTKAQFLGWGWTEAQIEANCS
jgi:hypothetical protein